MTTEDDLIGVLVSQEIIINGIHDIDKIKETPHYQVLKLLLDGARSKQYIIDQLPDENINMILFQLKGDGLISEEEGVITLTI